MRMLTFCSQGRILMRPQGRLRASRSILACPPPSSPPRRRRAPNRSGSRRRRTGRSSRRTSMARSASMICSRSSRSFLASGSCSTTATRARQSCMRCRPPWAPFCLGSRPSSPGCPGSSLMASSTSRTPLVCSRSFRSGRIRTTTRRSRLSGSAPPPRCWPTTARRPPRACSSLATALARWPGCWKSSSAPSACRSTRSPLLRRTSSSWHATTAWTPRASPAARSASPGAPGTCCRSSSGESCATDTCILPSPMGCRTRNGICH
mmetsp:Transcript_74972/g.217626  ORF Transcript_74972/g.217626 Transcript_74972/m.217626 type:complete len:264 (+) Transcript_74972:595-1386(+)